MPEGLALPSRISASAQPVSTPSWDSSRMLRTLITGERSTTPPTFSTSIKRVNFLSSARISRTSESVRRMSPLSGVRSLPSPEMRETT